MLGFNSREQVQDATYDIQTQRAADSEGDIETLVYRNGKVLATVRADGPEDDSLSSMQAAMNEHHDAVCGKVREGSYELVFLWLSRGIIAFESADYLQALESFESVLSVEETHGEANAYLDRIRGRLEEDAESRDRVAEAYRKQIETLEQTGRSLETARKKAVLQRIQQAPRKPQSPGPADDDEPVSAPPARQRRHLPRLAVIASVTLVLLVSIGLIAVGSIGRNDPDRLLARGRASLEEDRPGDAREAFLRVLQQRPDSAEALTGLWETFRTQGDFGEAARVLAGQVRPEGTPGRVYLLLAEAHRRASQTEEALRNYRTALQHGIDEPASRLGLGLCLLEQGDPEAAIKLWEESEAQGTDDYRFDFGLGMAYQAAGRLGRASFYFSRALKQQPGSATIYRALGSCLQGMHQEDQARKLWARAAELDGNSTDGPPAEADSAPTRFPFSLL